LPGVAQRAPVGKENYSDRARKMHVFLRGCTASDTTQDNIATKIENERKHDQERKTTHLFIETIFPSNTNYHVLPMINADRIEK